MVEKDECQQQNNNNNNNNTPKQSQSQPEPEPQHTQLQSSPPLQSKKQQEQQGTCTANNNNYNEMTAEEMIAFAVKRNKEKKSNRHGARNQHRHKQFVQWLLQTFPDIFKLPQQQKQQQQHVLDIAGGKGEVSARLSICHHQNVVLIDPRKADLLHCFQTLVLPKLPKKWQQRIQEKETANNHHFISGILQERFQQLEIELTERIIQPILLLRQQQQSINNNNNNNNQSSSDSSTRCNSRDDNTTSATTHTALQYAIEHASMILGLHADSATEIIIDMALQYSKPFVVVPCCVFPKLFPQRVLHTTNTPVRTYEQFCQYLVQKDERFQIDILPFDGRNIAIYWNGK